MRGRAPASRQNTSTPTRRPARRRTCHVCSRCSRWRARATRPPWSPSTVSAVPCTTSPKEASDCARWPTRSGSTGRTPTTRWPSCTARQGAERGWPDVDPPVVADVSRPTLRDLRLGVGETRWHVGVRHPWRTGCEPDALGGGRRSVRVADRVLRGAERVGGVRPPLFAVPPPAAVGTDGLLRLPGVARRCVRHAAYVPFRRADSSGEVSPCRTYRRTAVPTRPGARPGSSRRVL